MKRNLTLAVAVGLILAGIVVWRVRFASVERPMAGRPNVVLAMLCTTRRDQIEPYGGPKGLTPFLLETAERGATFDDAITSAPWTKPGSTAILTGQHALSIGMAEDGAGVNQRILAPEVTTLAEHLKAAGYATIGLTANPNLNALFGFDQGFDAYYEATGRWVTKEARKVTGDVMTAEALARVAEAPADAPIYLQIMLLDAHAPYRSSERDIKRWRRPADIPRKVAAYRGALARLDAELRGLHRGLARLGLTDENTLFVFVNDHGEGLRWPDHHGVAHGTYLFESTIGMVWLARGHGVAPGHRVGGMATQIDVLPTVLGMVGLPGPDGPGHDWSAQLRGQADATTRERVYTDTWFQRHSRAAVTTADVACHVDFAGGEPFPECYDRRADPHGTTPLADPPQALIDDVIAWRQARYAEYVTWPHTADADARGDTMKALEALGYVE